MFLHEDTEEFKRTCVIAAEKTGQPITYVVKDYYVTMMLKEIFSRNDQLVFKGGTALSKCYGVIHRFSEDIDLGIEEERATQGQRKKIKEAIKAAAKALGLEISNIDNTRSRRDFNRYEIPLPEDYSGSAVANTLFIETSVMTPITPTASQMVTSFITNYLSEIGKAEIVERYSLEPFEVKVTTLERSLCDKVFAICDYYLEGKDLRKPSRHIYDVHKLLAEVQLDGELRTLLNKVRQERRESSLNCPSAEENVNLAGVLTEIVDSEAYRPGYENTTMSLLNVDEDVSYDAAIGSTREIICFLNSEKR